MTDDDRPDDSAVDVITADRYELDLSEPPSVMLGDPGVLRSGMVVYIEPNCQTDGGNFMVEETYLITDDGCERLGGAAPDELPEID